MDEKFMREKPVLSLILSMALPMVISMLVNSLYNIVDSFFVARISEDAMTALSLVYPVQNFINAAGIGFGIGINAAISFYLGAGDGEKANTAAVRGLFLTVIHGIVLTVVCIMIMPFFLGLFTAEESVVSMGTRYCSIAFLFTVVIVTGVSFEKIFQATGRMKVTMVALMAGCIANIILDPLLIFGIGPFPRMDIEGAALATGIGQVLTLIIYLIVYIRRPGSIRISRKYLKGAGKMDLRLYAVGIPAVLNLALPSLLISALNGILASYSQMYVVILGIYYKLQTFLYLPANGIIQGMRPLIGYNYGAGEYSRVKKIYRVTLGLTAVIMLIGTLICLAVPDRLTGLFTESEETVRAGETALRIISAGFVISAVSVTSCGALEGLSKGVPSLVISLLRYAVIIIPAAWILSRLTGPSGVWHAFWIAEAVTAAAAFFVYRRSVGAER